jgi:hypothetical protein
MGLETALPSWQQIEASIQFNPENNPRMSLLIGHLKRALS